MAVLLAVGATTAVSPVPSVAPSHLSSGSRYLSVDSVRHSKFSAISISPATTTSIAPVFSVYCGRGDKKTAKGKRFRHSFGNSRPRDKTKGRGPPRVFMPPAPFKKDRSSKKEEEEEEEEQGDDDDYEEEE